MVNYAILAVNLVFKGVVIQNGKLLAAPIDLAQLIQSDLSGILGLAFGCGFARGGFTFGCFRGGTARDEGGEQQEGCQQKN